MARETHRVFVERWRCTECGEEFPLNSPQVDAMLRHRPPPPSTCGAQVHLMHRYHGRTKWDGVKEILNMDVTEFMNMEVRIVDGKILLKRA